MLKVIIIDNKFGLYKDLMLQLQLMDEQVNTSTIRKKSISSSLHCKCQGLNKGTDFTDAKGPTLIKHEPVTKKDFNISQLSGNYSQYIISILLLIIITLITHVSSQFIFKIFSHLEHTTKCSDTPHNTQNHHEYTSSLTYCRESL